MSLGNYNLKQQRDATTYLWERPKPINTENTKCWQGCGTTGTLHSVLVGKQYGIATLEDSLAVPYKTTHTLWSSNCTPWYLLKWIKNLCPHTNLLMDVYSSFIYNWPNLESTKMSFSRWINKLCYIQTMEYYSILKRN